MLGMAELEVGQQEEVVSQEPFFRLGHVSNAQIKDALEVFQSKGMDGPYAALPLMSLFEPLPAGGEIDGYVISETVNGQKPETLWDQVGPAFSTAKQLSKEQQDNLKVFQYFALDALVNDSLTRRFHGQDYGVNDVIKQRAQEIEKHYGNRLAEVLDPDSEQFDQLAEATGKVAKQVGKVTGFITTTLVIAGCMVQVGTAEIPTPLPPTQGAGEVQPGSENSPYLLSDVTKALDSWKTFETAQGTVSVDELKFMTDPNDPKGETMVFYNPQNIDGTVNTDVRLAFATASKATLAGKELPVPVSFLIEQDKKTGLIDVALVQFIGVSNTGTSIIEFQVGIRGSDGAVIPATYSFVYEEGKGFYETREGYELPWVVGTPNPSKPQQENGDVYNAMFKSVASQKDPIPLTPKPPEDPNGPEAKGYTKNAKGEYTRTDATTGFEYTWDAENKTGFRRVNKDFVLWDLPPMSNDAGFSDQQTVEILFDEKLPNETHLESISHPPRPADQPVDLNSIYTTKLRAALTRQGFDVEKNLFPRLVGGEFHLDYATSEGLQQWRLGPDSATGNPSKIIIKVLGNFSDHAPSVDPRFSELKDTYKKEDTHMYIRSWTDADGIMHVEASPELLDGQQLTPRQLAMIILWGPSVAMDGKIESGVGTTLYELLDAEFVQAQQKFFEFTFAK
jgi:hypothetical protein